MECCKVSQFPNDAGARIWLIDQLHVSNGILIDFIIKRDVTAGSLRNVLLALENSLKTSVLLKRDRVLVLY